jgi:hypothetical protein
MTLDACSFDSGIDDDDGSLSGEEAIDFDLHFYTATATATHEREGRREEDNSPPIHIADRDRLAKRWPFFRRLLDAGLSEARSGHADLSPYFSLRLGQCLVDYFDGNPIQVSSLSTRDCRDLIEHADYFGFSDTLLLTFCIAKLKGEIRKARRWQ